MIVRILTEGQFNVDGADLDALNKIDNQVVEAISANDEKRFAILMVQMRDLVHKKGRRLPQDQISESDIILPPPDSTMAEVRDLFVGEGLIPG